MVNKFGTARLYDASPEEVTPQEHVNLQMMKAIEMIGRRLERTENQRDQLAERLALIESAASVDEKTGKLYLPVVVEPCEAVPSSSAPWWTVGVSLMSSVLAIFALGLSLYREPTEPSLTPRQLAALNALAEPMQFVSHENRGWKKVDESEGIAPKEEAAAGTPAVTPEPAPSDSGTLKLAEIQTHLWPDVFGPPKPSSAEAPSGWRVAETPKEKVVPEQEPVAEAAVEQPAPPPVAEAPKPEEKVAETPVPPAVKPASPVQQAEEQAPPKPAADKPDEKTASLEIGPDPALSPKLAELEKRAFSGAPEAQHDIAIIYAAGKAVRQDYKRAAYWFYKAADGGIANADYNLGVMFQQGMGVRKDVNKALGWYEKAAQLGHPEAMYNLGIAYVEGVGTPRNIERGVSYFKKAANAGVAQAAYNLGVLYESNFVGPIDLAKASEWYQVAADQGHATAKDAVSRLHQQIADAAATGDKAGKAAAAVEPASGAKEAQADGGVSSPANEDLVMNLQSALIARGDISGKASGVLDDKTVDAIRSWQKKLGFVETGLPSPELVEGIRAASAQK